MKTDTIRNKRIFVTGGTGFMGKSLLRHCDELKENDIVLLTPEPERRLSEMLTLCKGMRIKFLQGDVRDFKFPDREFDYIIHVATTSCKMIPDNEMSSVVIEGTKRVLEFARLNPNLSNLLYVSSGAVYGNSYEIPLEEEFACDPATVYGRSKFEAERLCLNSGIPCSLARCFAFVGEFLPLDAHFAIGNFIRDCLACRDIIIRGDGIPIRTYLYAGDLARWLWTIMRYGKTGRCYNVGSDSEISIAQLAETVRAIAGKNNEVRILQPPSQKSVQRYAPNISRAKSELGLNVNISLETAIRLTLNYHSLATGTQIGRR